MLRETALAWVQANCPLRALQRDVGQFLDASAARGHDCWMVIGRDLTRRRQPFLLQCFADELFVFQLTEQQAAARDVGPAGLLQGSNPRKLGVRADPPLVAIERFEVEGHALTCRQPIVGRLRYDVGAGIASDVCVRLDYALGRDSHTAWDYTHRALQGRGELEVRFLPIAPEPVAAVGFRGPLALFVHVVEVREPVGSLHHRPVSNAAATLVDVR